MTKEQAQGLSIGCRVQWGDNPADAGTVVEKGYCAAKVEFDTISDDGTEYGTIMFGNNAELVFLKDWKKLD